MDCHVPGSFVVHRPVRECPIEGCPNRRSPTPSRVVAQIFPIGRRYRLLYHTALRLTFVIYRLRLLIIPSSLDDDLVALLPFFLVRAVGRRPSRPGWFSGL